MPAHARRSRWTRPARPRDTFPPYRLADPDLVGRAEATTRKLRRIYHVAHANAWDGREVLASLVDRHGGIHVPEDRRDALARVCSVLLWGELAAWSISADIATKLDDCDAKMAASSQVFDDARHFYVLRDYLWQAGLDVPPLGGFSRQLLVDLLETDNLLHKLVGMQLLVENTAIVLFRMLARARIEPVLSDLLPYYERDEARHVGLGVLALPGILRELSRRDAAALWLFQLRINLMMLAGGLTLRDAFETLGIDQAEMQRLGFRMQRQVYDDMREALGGSAADGTRGLLRVGRAGQERLNAFLFPRAPAEALPRWHLPALRAVIRAARAGDRYLRRRAPTA
ncbi:MAG: ferritin-like domain-containing protein [Deltaproteobacteria bacterium]|nr:MAG: ferritin-like domain-containing protein [Deltaproteobacteria bacterium]